MWGRASSAERGNDRLAVRRKNRRRRGLIVFFILLLLLLAATIYGLQQSSVRISQVVVYGADALPAIEQESFVDIASEAMRGNYFGIIPRDSTLFFPASRIRSDIIALHPGIAAVSISRNGLTGLSIKINERVPIAKWCGLAPTPGADEYCYVFDASGFIFSTATTSFQTLNNFALYAPLEVARGGPPAASEIEPLRATIASAEKLPAIFDFARQLATFGSPVTHLVVRTDEVDNYLKSGTRITYVLGNEQNAFTALVSARDNLNLADGSLEYVDLRFDRKMYLKKR